ncbi:hypothetical protein H2200_004528 [Cladophialophora chaetospira]|uniref:Uncharacterized protein n=1 Tax=Cladophialophora chaetospira TaxID=386627 RepID=A0AA39CKJ1_9EURO|nr:hypothetical protein H2200_004528 [Cladophialophora chaetospira]
MSLTHSQRSVGGNSYSSSRATGLRSRQTSSPAHPPVSFSPPNLSVDHLEPSKAQSKAANLPDVTPLTPATANTENRKKSWVNSASKTLGLSKLRQKTSSSQARAMGHDSAVPSRTQSTRKLLVQPHNLTGSSRSPVPAPLTHQQQSSPPVPTGANHLQNPSPSTKHEKPLPSLPVATVKYQSPVRRSLIDCTEKPLRRRSTTPPDGAGPVEEDWPTIEPTKSETKLPRNETSTQIKPSLGESLYEGMRALNLRDNKEEVTSQSETKSPLNDATATGDKEHCNVPASSLDAQVGDGTPGELLSDGRNRPISSSQLPKPRDSMLKSLSRHHDSPIAIRQTKTSALRLQQATGKSTWDPNEKAKSASTHIHMIRERAESPVPSRTKQDFQGGPVRTNSRSRYAVTGRGSPYTIPSRAPSSRKPVPRDESRSHHRALHATANNHDSDKSQDEKTAQSPPSPSPVPRKSSLPLPARLTRQSANLGDEQHEGINPQQEASMITPEEKGETTAIEASISGMPNTRDQAVSNVNNRDYGSLTQSKLLNLKEALSTPHTDDVASFIESDEDAPGTSVHGYDSYGGFRIRRIGNDKSKMGPTLRITDSASRVLLGRDEETNILNARSPVTLRHKGSAPEVGSPRVVKDRTRRSSAIMTNLPNSTIPTRNVSSRTTSNHTNTNGGGSRLPSDGDSSVDTVVVRAELPGSEVKVGFNDPPSNSDNWTAAVTPSRPSTSTQGSLKSKNGDWPGKEFADLNLCADATPSASRDHTRRIGLAAEPGSRRLVSKSPARPPTIVLREAPSKETAPFLFQDLNQDQGKQEKLADDLTKAAASGSETSVATHPMYSRATDSSSSLIPIATAFPPRSSSRKPKPPPIVVSPPSISFLPNQAPKAYAVPAEEIKKPRNVKTFSQSLSPHTESTRGRKISAVLSNSPSTSVKKVGSSLRGLFHKKSFEEKKATAAAFATKREEVEPVPAIPATIHEDGGIRRPSFRRKPVPAFDTPADSINQGNKVSNPLHLNSTAPVPTGMRTLKHKTAFPASPTTPWTANLKTPAYPPSSYPTATMTTNGTSSSSKPNSPSGLAHAHPSPSLYSPCSPNTPGTPSQLSTATTLTHALLDLARAEHTPTKKSQLIELSKCMVEVVNSARDAEKAMEKARMEASRAEVSYLKCLKEVGAIEGLVSGIGIVEEVDRKERRVKEI